jgi:hypothetical protein
MKIVQKKIALVACSNGLGHIRRLIILSQELIKLGAIPTLFAPLKSVNKLTRSIGGKLPELYDFDSHTTVDDWMNGDAFTWYKYLPNLSGYDQVVSDNLVEILLVRSDAWLMGSFFWHESLVDFNIKQKSDLRRMLLSHRPKIISSTLFSAPYLSNYAHLYNVGLFSSKQYIRKCIKKDKRVLIACGMGGDVIDQAKSFVNWLAREKDIPFDTVYVEPCIIPNDPPKWMVPASFTKSMYDNILAAVIRPGIGTITDSLCAGARIFTFFEKGNLEMQVNSKIIDDAGVGCGGFEIKDAWLNACNYCKSGNMQINHEKNINKLDFDGVEKAAQLLL